MFSVQSKQHRGMSGIKGFFFAIMPDLIFIIKSYAQNAIDGFVSYIAKVAENTLENNDIITSLKFISITFHIYTDTIV